MEAMDQNKKIIWLSLMKFMKQLLLSIILLFTLGCGRKLDNIFFSSEGKQPIGYAIMIAEDAKKLQQLIDQDKDVIKHVDRSGNTLSHLAAMHKSPGCIKILIENGAEIDAKNFQGFTPLMLSCSTSNMEITKLLINAGANINTQNQNGTSPLTCHRVLRHRFV
jgi:ankyrin repeat protein